MGLFDDQLNDEEKQKLQDYGKNLSTPDPKKEAMKKYFEDLKNNQSKAIEIAARGPFQDKTPEEQAFEEQHLDPMSRGMLQGGVMGGISKVGSGIAKAAPGAFGRISSMLKGAAPAVEQDLVTAGKVIPKSASEFVNTAAKLEASHPSMVNNRNIINGMVDELGAQHPDVQTLQQMYNRMLK